MQHHVVALGPLIITGQVTQFIAEHQSAHANIFGYIKKGALAGLVSVTAGCSLITPWIGLIAGAIGGAIFLGARWVILYKLKVDDPVDAVALHGCCGIWGCIVVGLFAKEQYVSEVYGHTGDYGLFMGGKGNLLGCQIIGVMSIIGWVSATLGPIFYVMRITGFLRASSEEESAGLDETEHARIRAELDARAASN